MAVTNSPLVPASGSGDGWRRFDLTLFYVELILLLSQSIEFSQLNLVSLKRFMVSQHLMMFTFEL